VTATTTGRRLTCPPLYGTARSPERPTLGPKVAEVAARLGKPPMPHQQHIFDVAFEIDPDTGLLAYSEVIVIGPRQATGKTELLLPVMTHRCVGFDDALAEWSRRQFGHDVPAPGPQRVLYTAQTADDARKKWRDVHVERLKASRFRREFRARLQQNMEAFVWANGSMWAPGSTTGKTGGTGDTLDLGVIDEAWSREDSRTELGMRPAMMTRPWKQLWAVSMIPGLSRALPGTWPWLAHKRQVGRARVDAGVRRGTAFFDFSAAPGLDPADPQTWWSCMPGLGYTVTEKTVREDFEAFDLVDFEAEYLGWEPLASTPRWKLVRQETWERLRDSRSEIVGRPVLSAEVAEDRSAAWITAAGRRADGDWHVEVVEPGFRIPRDVVGLDWLEPRMVELVGTQNPWTVVVDPSRPAQSLIVPLRQRGIDVTTPSQREVAGACGRFYDATGEEAPVVLEDADGQEAKPGVRVHHLGQEDLDSAVSWARKLDLGNGSFVFVKKGSEAVLCPLYGVALAMHGHDVKSVAEVEDKIGDVW